jgi:3-hydroxyisobutyrate dehydrogenase-like beta-hydroxyacid dehydrogenase
MAQKIGFIGLGIMGDPMARNVVTAGFDLLVFNRTAEKAAPHEKLGAKMASSPKAVAESVDVVILMLSDIQAIEDVLHGDDGVLAGMTTGKVLINMSTVSPAYTQKVADTCAARSIIYVDAPVSGSRKPAEEGALVILAGGPEDKIAELEPLLLTMGKKVVYCGEAGKGSSMKMAVNLLLGTVTAGLCEAVNLGQKCGLDTETIVDTILAGAMGCVLYEIKKPMIVEGSYGAQFPLKHMTKDLRFALQTADDNGAAAPIGNAIFQVYRQSMGHGLGDQDFAAVKKTLERMNDDSE